MLRLLPGLLHVQPTVAKMFVKVETGRYVPKCPRDSLALVPICPDTSAPISWCRNVLSPKCPGSKVS